MVERKTVKPESGLYERMNERRKGRGDSWDEFFEALLDGHESDEPDGQRIERGDSQQLDRIEELVRNTPERTANEVEGRMSRR